MRGSNSKTKAAALFVRRYAGFAFHIEQAAAPHPDPLPVKDGERGFFMSRRLPDRFGAQIPDDRYQYD